MAEANEKGPGMFRSMRRYILIGLLTAAPLGITYVILEFLFTLLSDIGEPWIRGMARGFRPQSPALADLMVNEVFMSITASLIVLLFLSMFLTGVALIVLTVPIIFPVALALGVLISPKAPTHQTAMMTSMFALLMPTMLLSGFLFPIASMPSLLQYISKIIPAKYFIQIEQAIMLKAAGWDAVAFPALILFIMLIVLLTAAWRNFQVVYK